MSSNNSNRKNENPNKKRRGPPERVRGKCNRAGRCDDGAIAVCDDPIAELAEQVNWDNLSPFEEWVVSVMEENDLVDDK